MYKQVYHYVIPIVLFWWFALAAWGFARGEVDLATSLPASFAMLVLCVIGVGFGMASVVAWIILDRQARCEMLSPDNVRGLISTIGDVPLNAKEPHRANELPDFASVPDVPKSFYPLWIEHYQNSHPYHVAFVKGLLQVYQHNKDLPATHVKGGHGGRTLLEHSLLVAYQMQNLAMKWSYTGLRDRSGKKVTLKLRDEKYTFDPMDPIILIVGLAHDIGKIESYLYQDDEIVGSHHEHDLTGARILARMPEMWRIPEADRIAMLLAVAHYHHPMELPLSPDRRAIDDRTIAVMELLIKADFVASAIESKGIVPSEQDYEETMDARQVIPDLDQAMWHAFLDIINETGRINSADPRYNVGTICQVEGQNSMRLLIREDAIRNALMRKLGITDSPTRGDGRHELSLRLMRLLDEHGVLVKKIREMEYSTENAFWEMRFIGKKKGKTELTRLAGWPFVIVVLPQVTEYVASLPSYGWVGQVERGSMGGARQLSKNGTGSAAPAASGPEQSPAQDGAIAANAVIPAPVAPPPQQPAARPGGKLASPPQQSKKKKVHGFGGDLDALKAASRTQKERFEAARHAAKVNAAPAAEALPMQSAGEAIAPAKPQASPQAAEDQDDNAMLPGPEPVTEELDEIDMQPVLHDPTVQVSGVLLTPEPAPKKGQAVLPITPYVLKEIFSTVLKTQVLAKTDLQSMGEVYLLSRELLELHFPDFNWEIMLPEILERTVDRQQGFLSFEDNGTIWIGVQVPLIQQFMASPATADAAE